MSFFLFASRNLLLSVNCLITRSSSLLLACSQCFFWSSWSVCVHYICPSLLCCFMDVFRESGLIDLWSWPLGQLQGIVRINEDKKVHLIQYSSLSERVDECAELPRLEEWYSDNCERLYVNLSFVFHIQHGGDVFSCLSHSSVLSRSFLVSHQECTCQAGTVFFW